MPKKTRKELVDAFVECMAGERPLYQKELLRRMLINPKPIQIIYCRKRGI